MTKIDDFQVREEDIFVSAFPKSGTTLVQEIVYHLQNEMNFEHSTAMASTQRIPFLDGTFLDINEIDKMPSPRTIKTHLPFQYMPKQFVEGKGKVVCVLRNPKDVSVSMYFMARALNMIAFRGTFAEFFPHFKSGFVFYGPWWNYIRDLWGKRDDERYLILFYEDLIKDRIGAIKQIAKFLNVSHLNDEQIEKLAEFTSFDAMKNNRATNGEWSVAAGKWNKDESTFIRKGQVGDWKNYYDEAMSKSIDDICAKYFDPVGLSFTYE